MERNRMTWRKVISKYDKPPSKKGATRLGIGVSTICIHCSQAEYCKSGKEQVEQIINVIVKTAFYKEDKANNGNTNFYVKALLKSLNAQDDDGKSWFLPTWLIVAMGPMSTSSNFNTSLFLPRILFNMYKANNQVICHYCQCKWHSSSIFAKKN